MNVAKADYLLRQNGHPIEGVNSAGVISFQAGTTEQQIAAAYAFLATIDDTPLPTPIKDYAQGFINNLALWVKLHKAIDDERNTFDISTATAGTILSKVRAQLKAVRAIIATAPQGVIDKFHQERVLQGSTTALPFTDAAIDGMTVAECRICLSVARLAANQGLAIVSAYYALNE